MISSGQRFHTIPKGKKVKKHKEGDKDYDPLCDEVDEKKPTANTIKFCNESMNVHKKRKRRKK